MINRGRNEEKVRVSGKKRVSGSWVKDPEVLCSAPWLSPAMYQVVEPDNVPGG